MLDEPLFTLSSSHETQIDPHRLFYSHVAYMHDKRIWQIRRPIFPCGKREPCILSIDRPQANAERRGIIFPTRPSLPNQGAPSTWTLGLSFIAHPKQFNHGIDEGKSATGRTLTRMLIWRSLTQTEPNKFFSLGRTWSGTDEQMVQLYPHSR